MAVAVVAAVVAVGGVLATRGGDDPLQAPGTVVKPPIQGLVDRSDIAPPAIRPIVANFVVNVAWGELQAQPGGPIANDNPIERAVATARRESRSGGSTELRLKVRLFAGVQAPDWAKQLGGGPVTVNDPTDGRSGTIGRFWTSEFGAAYSDLQGRLAERYDEVAEIAEITASRCTTVYAEPFVRQTGDPPTVRALLDAGFTAEADRRCLEEQVDAHRVWGRTRTSVAFNPYQRIEADATTSTDGKLTASMMLYCRRLLGPRCVLENNSIRWPPLGRAYDEMYSTMRRLGPPISFQTATPARIGDWRLTLDWAARQGANYVELNGEYPSYPSDELADLSRRLAANPPSRAGGGGVGRSEGDRRTGTVASLPPRR